MGCNVSRLDSRGGPTAALPARLRPLILQRLEDIRARRHARGRALKDPTPSKKELLSHDDIKNHEEDNNASHHGHSPIHHIFEDSIKKPELTEGKEPRGEVKEEAPNNNKEIIGITTTTVNNDDVKVEVVKEGSPQVKGKSKTKKESPRAKIEDAFTSADEDDDDDDDNDDDERMIGYEDDEAFPGSPSFRVYFEGIGEGCHDDDICKVDAFKETVSGDDTIPSSKESSVEKKVKRGRKRRSFRRVLPKGGQAAVRNLLNVKSCYTNSSGHHDNAHLLTAKPTTSTT